MAESATTDVSPIGRVGFVGLGNMGGPMARNVVAAGFDTVVYDLDTSKVAAVVAEGATASSSVRELASSADIVLTSLPGPAQVRAVGAELFDAMAPGTVWIDLSTNDLDCAGELARLATGADIDLLDAPVTGGAEGAEAGTLWILVGGDAEVHARVVPVLAAVGERFDLLGPHGAGYVAKIASVSLCYLQSVCVTEALLLGAKGGADPEKMLEIIQNSTGRSYVADRYGPEILNGGYDATFDLGLAAKDLRLARQLAATVGADLPFTTEVSVFYDATVDEFGTDAPHLIAMQALERRNDLIFHDPTTDRTTVPSATQSQEAS